MAFSSAPNFFDQSSPACTRSYTAFCSLPTSLVDRRYLSRGSMKSPSSTSASSYAISTSSYLPFQVAKSITSASAMWMLGCVGVGKEDS